MIVKKEKHTILIIGSGGREHALGWKLKQSPKVDKIYFAPGNGGTSQIGENIDISALDVNKLLKFAIDTKIDFTVVGPDDALALGVVDAFEKKGLAIFGPTKDAAKLEWSKAFAKQFMKDEGIPTATYQTFTDAAKAKTYIQQQEMPVVIKASGLALGKGVIIARTMEEAKLTIDEIMVKKVFGGAGEEVIIEEYLEGREISVHVFCDGDNFSVFPTSRDHKRLKDKDAGPNTGGMGTVTPLPYISEKEIEEITKTVVLPVIHGMKKRGIPFKGLLYPGLMMTKKGLRVLEFNARFGDPETQSYMRLLKTDLFTILLACTTGTLVNVKIEWERNSACCIVLASGGYPGVYKKGDIIYGLEKAAMTKDIVAFHAGTRSMNNQIFTNGGRILGISAIGKDLNEALDKAYTLIGGNGVHFSNMQYRKDIGKI